MEIGLPDVVGPLAIVAAVRAEARERAAARERACAATVARNYRPRPRTLR